MMLPFQLKYLLVLLATFVLVLAVTPLVRKLAFRIGAVDDPNARRINQIPMPTAGGLGIYGVFAFSALVLLPPIVLHRYEQYTYFDYAVPVVLTAGIVVLTGLVDDILELKPLPKLLGITLAASLIWILTDFRFSDFKIPFGGPLIAFPDWLSFLLTVIWIVAITNAVNLLDGLDGLVSGVSMISLTTMGLVSYYFLYDTNIYLTIIAFVLVAALAGFLPYNYHPAVIYLGDTGALFIGFIISVLSLQGLKNSTAVAVLTPMIILGVPLTDTVVAIIRRYLSGKRIFEADKMHLHHRLLSMGLSHRATVNVIYGISFFFSLAALLFNVSSNWGGLLLGIGLLAMVEIFCELLGILGENRTPVLSFLRRVAVEPNKKENSSSSKDAEEDVK